MTFIRKDKQSLLELINHIEQNYGSRDAFAKGPSNKITLPSRLMKRTADIVAQTYEQEVLASLTGTEVELLLTNLLKAIESTTFAIANVIAALPETAPAGMVKKLKQHATELEAMKKVRDTLFHATGALLESDRDVLTRKEELDSLQQQYDELLAAQAALRETDLNALRADVMELESALAPDRDDLRRLQEKAALLKAEVASLDGATQEARQALADHQADAKEMFGRLLEVSRGLIDALAPHLEQCQASIREVAVRLTAKTEEANQLRQELQNRVAEMRSTLAETESLATALKWYGDSNQLLARNIPAVLEATKEKLRDIEKQLGEVDSDLNDALARHQQAVCAIGAPNAEAASHTA